jgi:hypothetical protein
MKEAKPTPARHKSRYRKVDPRIWNDARFSALSDLGKLGFILLLTHPNMTALGAMRGTVAGLAEELGKDVEAFRADFAQMVSMGMVEHDPKAFYIGLPRFLDYNPPASPNTVKAWATSLDLLPECDHKSRLLARCQKFATECGETWAQAFQDAFADVLRKASGTAAPKVPATNAESAGKACDMASDKACDMTSLNQEQEQEQEQDSFLRKGGAAALPGSGDAWAGGKSLLIEQGTPKEQAGAFIGSLIKKHKEKPVLDVLCDAVAKQPADARSWIVKALETRSPASPRPTTPDFASKDYTKGFGL